MITLTGQREIAKCNVYRDDVDPLSWYIMPQSPRIALDDNGRPIVSVVWYRREVSALSEEERRTRLGGGILTLSVELGATDEQMQEIRTQISRDPVLQRRLGLRPQLRRWWQQEIDRDPDRLAEALKISTVPIVDGSVTITVLAETPETGTSGEFVNSLVGAGRVSMTGSQRASFMSKLTQEGVVLLWNMMENRLAAVRVAYDLKFNHRLDAITMLVHADARKSYEAVQDQWQTLNEDASFSERHRGSSSTYGFRHDEVRNARNDILVTAQASESVYIRIIPEGGDDAVSQEQIDNLTRTGNEMVKDFLASAFLEWSPGEGFEAEEQPDLETELPKYSGGSGGDREYGHHGIEHYNMKTWEESMSANLDYRFKSQAVLSSFVAPNDNLSDLLQGHPIEEFRTRIDLAPDWYNYLDVEILCTADFESEPVDLVKAQLKYNATGPQGDINRAESFVFEKDTGAQHFATFLAAPDKRSYDYECEVFYKGTSDRFFFEGQDDNDVLVLDTDTLGVLSVDIQVGEVDWQQIRSVLVKMWYGRGNSRKETEFTLSNELRSHQWSEAIGREVDEPYHYQLTFVDIEGQRIEIDEEESRSRNLVVTQPIGSKMEITVIPTGSFAPDGLISHIVVALRYRDEVNDYVVEDTVTLSGPQESELWEVPLIDEDKRDYQYMEKTIYSDGVVRETGWLDSGTIVLTVGDKFDFRLQITPRLLAGRGFLFGTLHLMFDDDPANIHLQKTLSVDDFTKPLFWRFRLGDPDRHTYRYQLTLFKETGERVVLDEEEQSHEVLVLSPPTV